MLDAVLLTHLHSDHICDLNDVITTQWVMCPVPKPLRIFGPPGTKEVVAAIVCSHAPGITGRAHLADPTVKDAFHGAFRRMGEELRAARPDALIVVGAEHFGNFFMNNMPSFAIGMADQYEGPIEDPKWIGFERTQVPGNAALSKKIVPRDSCKAGN